MGGKCGRQVWETSLGDKCGSMYESLYVADRGSGRKILTDPVKVPLMIILYLFVSCEVLSEVLKTNTGRLGSPDGPIFRVLRVSSSCLLLF